MQQRPPIVVDTITSGWDVASALADSVAGLGAVGALLVAALVYRRQVNDARRAQASHVTVTVYSDATAFTGADVGQKACVYNQSTLPIYRVATLIKLPDETSFGLPPVSVIGAQNYRIINLPAGHNEDGIEAEITFNDASGRSWTRHTKGELRPVRAR